MKITEIRQQMCIYKMYAHLFRVSYHMLYSLDEKTQQKKIHTSGSTHMRDVNGDIIVNNADNNDFMTHKQ